MSDDVVQQPTALAFLAARMLTRGRHTEPRCTGISSDALALYGVDCAPEPHRGQYPADRADLQACERTWLMAPDEARARMLPMLVKYRVHVVAQWAGRAATP